MIRYIDKMTGVKLPLDFYFYDKESKALLENLLADAEIVEAKPQKNPIILSIINWFMKYAMWHFQ